MSATACDELTSLLRRTQAGDSDAEQQLVALLYQDLRVIAAQSDAQGTARPHLAAYVAGE